METELIHTPKRRQIVCLAGAWSLAVLITCSLPDAALGWRWDLDGTFRTGHGHPGRDWPAAVQVDGSGDVVAAATLVNAGSLADFTIVKLGGENGRELWRHDIDGSASGPDAVHDVTFDDAGDVIAVGRLWNEHPAGDFVVVKLTGATGLELWRQAVEPGLGRSLAVDAAGDVLAAGWSREHSADNPDRHFVVVKLAGTNGVRLWRRDVGAGSAERVTVDAEGHVLAAGTLGPDFAVVKLAGTSGLEVWRHVPHTSSSAFVGAQALAVDPANDVVAAGVLSGGEDTEDFAVVKCEGATGKELWRLQIHGRGDHAASTVVIDGSGDVVAGGVLEDENYDDHFVVTKVAGETGVELWRRHVGMGIATTVAVDGRGDVIATGVVLKKSPGDKYFEGDFVTVKLAGATGAELWRHEIDGPASDYDRGGRAAAVDRAGNVIAAGVVRTIPSARAPRRADAQDVVVIKLDGTDGTHSGPPLLGCTLSPKPNCITGFEKGRLVADERRTGKARLVLQWSKGPALAPSDLGSPLFRGGTAYLLCVYDDADDLVGEYTVDRAGALCGARSCWTRLHTRRRSGYRYTDTARTAAGIGRLELVTRLRGKLHALVNGTNTAARTHRSLAEALQSSLHGATIQLLSNQGACISAALPTVQVANGAVYKAFSP